MFYFWLYKGTMEGNCLKVSETTPCCRTLLEICYLFMFHGSITKIVRFIIDCPVLWLRQLFAILSSWIPVSTPRLDAWKSWPTKL